MPGRLNAGRRPSFERASGILDAAPGLPRRGRRGSRIALVNSLGNIASFASTYSVGWMTDLTHSTSASLYLFAGFLVIGGLLVLAVPGRLVNK